MSYITYQVRFDNVYTYVTGNNCTIYAFLRVVPVDFRRKIDNISFRIDFF